MLRVHVTAKACCEALDACQGRTLYWFTVASLFVGGSSSDERPTIQDVFVKLMGDQYGLDHIDLEEDGRLKVVVGEESAVIDLATLSPATDGKVQMTCSNDDLHKNLSAVVRRLCHSFRTI